MPEEISSEQSGPTLRQPPTLIEAGGISAAGVAAFAIGRWVSPESPVAVVTAIIELGTNKQSIYGLIAAMALALVVGAGSRCRVRYAALLFMVPLYGPLIAELVVRGGSHSLLGLELMLYSAPLALLWMLIHVGRWCRRAVLGRRK